MKSAMFAGATTVLLSACGSIPCPVPVDCVEPFGCTCILTPASGGVDDDGGSFTAPNVSDDNGGPTEDDPGPGNGGGTKDDTRDHNGGSSDENGDWS